MATIIGTGCARLPIIIPQDMGEQPQEIETTPNAVSTTPTDDIASTVPDPPQQKAVIFTLEATGEPRLMAGDAISIDVAGEEELSREFSVPTNGVINYPLVREVEVQGKTVRELTAELTAKLSKYLTTPVINVAITRWKERKVYVYGAQKNSQVVPLPTGDVVTVSRLLIAVGISSGTVDLGEVTLIRQDQDGQSQMIRIDLSAILEKHDLSQDVVMQHNDLIVLKEAPKIHIQGGVSRPGSFPMQKSHPMGLLDLIAAADGPQTGADIANIQILRRVGENRRELKIASASVHSAQEMFYLCPDDIVIVPYQSANYATIYGEVRKPGTVPLTSDRPMRLSTVIAMAGGVTEYASSSIRVFRYTGKVGPQKFNIDFGDITSGDAEQDMEIKPHDVIYIEAGIW